MAKKERKNTAKKEKRRKIIYFVEDDKDTIEVYQLLLERAGFKVESDLYGDDAIRTLEKINAGKKERPDIVLIDLLLLDMNGVEVMKRIRELENIKDLPIMTISNYAGEELAKMAKDLGSEKFITKVNFTPSQMVELMKKRLG